MRTHRFDPREDDGEAKSRNNNSSREEVRQFPAGTAGCIAVVTYSSCNEVGNGADEVKY